MENLLEIKDLTCSFDTEEGQARALDGVSFGIGPGETLGLVGESGCGKTVTALCIMRLVQSPPGRVDRAEILFKGQDLNLITEKEMRKIRGNEISMVFQEPMTSLNPVFTCGYQVSEAVVLHQKLRKKEAQAKTLEMLNLVKIPDPRRVAKSYPHQLSGGMRQRVMIAMALSCNPSLLIADEPTTALDVTIQAQILDLLQSLQQQFNMAILMITHDLGVIAEMARRVVVMYAGKVMEVGGVREIFQQARHPYTLGLLKSIPRLDRPQDRLDPIPGRPPVLSALGDGCPFAPRCAFVQDRCHREYPDFRAVDDDHRAACWVDVAAGA